MGGPEHEFARVGALSDFAVGAGSAVHVGDSEACLVRASECEVYITGALCPHRGGLLSAGRVGRTMRPSAPGCVEVTETVVLECPWHGYEFDPASGQVLFTDVNLRLRTFEVEIRHGEVYARVRRR